MTWKWHITMATSILHRASGMALYLGAILLTGWLLSIAMGEESYNQFAGLMGSPIGLFILFGFTAAVMYHLANGIRHLFWDAGTGYQPGVANLTAWATIIFAAVSSVGIWAYILLVLNKGG